MEKELQNSLNWKEIGQRFRELRESKGLDQIDLVKKAQAFNNAICQYEAGTAPASTNYALFLRNEFGSSFDWLYDGDTLLKPYEDTQKKRVLDPHAIGARLKGIREQLNLNKEEFGKVIGVTGKAIAQYEIGARKPDLKVALRIKRALGKPLDWIYFGDEPIVPKKNRLRSNQIKSNQSSSESKKKSRL